MQKLIFLIILTLTFSIASRADRHDFSIGNLNYTVISEEEKQVALIGYVTEPMGELIIPSYVVNDTSLYNVTIIELAFRGCSGLTSVTIPNSVTFIGPYSFEGCSGLTSVTIPNSVNTIGPSAFFQCSGLTSVTIPNSVTSIGFMAFTECSSLTTVNIPSSVIEIGEAAFFGCSGLDSVNIPNSVTSIGRHAFTDCGNLKSVIIPDSMTSIETGTFAGCFSLTSVTIPESIASIGKSAFAGCRSLTSVSIPNSVTEIGEEAFSGCDSLTSIAIPRNVTEIGAGAFSYCQMLDAILVNTGNANYTSTDNVLYNKDKTILVQCPGAKNSYIIPNSVTEIDKNAFAGCRNLTSVTFSDSVKKIGWHAFRDCSSLSSVTIPMNVTEIGIGAFEGCSSLSSVSIGNSVNEICNSAFFKCNGIRKLYIYCTIPPKLGELVFSLVPKDAVVYIPKGTLQKYINADGWEYFSDFREIGVLLIKLSDSNISIEKGKTFELAANITKDDDVTIESESWISSNPDVAIVDNGIITAVDEGSTNITYTIIDGYGRLHTEYCKVTVCSDSGINDIETDIDSAYVLYYNLNGMRVNAIDLTPGLYIRIKGAKATKILVK